MADVTCATCGKPRKGHNYRHLFVAAVVEKREFVTVKVPKAARESADKLVQLVSNSGWKALKIDRDDPVSLSSIFEEGIRLLTLHSAK